MGKKPGRPRRSEAQAQAIRTTIANQALALFHQEGFGSVSIRRLAKEVGCAPMTIYAHFDGKADILRYLWADVLGRLVGEIRREIALHQAPQQRLRLAARMFVQYWLSNPDQFRLVFMSGGVERRDVDTFVQNDDVLGHFRFFTELVKTVLVKQGGAEVSDIKLKTDVLISGLIGIALCANTIRDYPWSEAEKMADALVSGV